MDAPKKDNEGKEGLYDMVIPLGTPVTVIRELVDSFEVDLVRRKMDMDMTGEVMHDREVLVIRGDLETIMAAKEHMLKALEKKVDEWNNPTDERAKRLQKAYEERLKERANEPKEPVQSEGDVSSYTNISTGNV
jgi:hypothetical protein